MGKINRKQIIKAILFGSCEIPKIGDPLNIFTQSELLWAEKTLTPSEIKKRKRPLWTYSGKISYGGGGGYGGGYGDGYGYGDGDGYGGGGGYGYGDGYGDGGGHGIDFIEKIKNIKNSND